MIAVITSRFNTFYEVSKIDELFCNSKWVNKLEKISTIDWEGYVLAPFYNEVEELQDILAHLSLHNVKEIK